MSFVFVVGAWGGGTSAVAGALHKLGCVGVEPFVNIGDPRTRNTYESHAYRAVLFRHISEPDIQLRTQDRREIVRSLAQFRDTLPQTKNPIFLKHPLSAMILPEIAEVFSPRFIFIFRPVSDIEASRQRRGWPAHLGAKGASLIYAQMMRFYINEQSEIFMLRYPTLLANTRLILSAMANFTELGEKANIEAALDYVRKD